MNTANLSLNTTYSSYPAFCEALAEVPKINRKSQNNHLKEISKYVRFVRQRGKYTVLEVYEKPHITILPPPRRDRRTKKLPHYAGYIEAILIQYCLRHADEHGVLYISTPELYTLLGMTNENFLNRKNNKVPLGKLEEVQERLRSLLKGGTQYLKDHEYLRMEYGLNLIKKDSYAKWISASSARKKAGFYFNKFYNGEKMAFGFANTLVEPMKKLGYNFDHLYFKYKVQLSDKYVFTKIPDDQYLQAIDNLNEEVVELLTKENVFTPEIIDFYIKKDIHKKRK